MLDLAEVEKGRKTKWERIEAFPLPCPHLGHTIVVEWEEKSKIIKGGGEKKILKRKSDQVFEYSIFNQEPRS